MNLRRRESSRHRGTLATVLFSLAFAIACPSTCRTNAQTASSQPPAWQTAAGGHAEFEVASIRPAQPCNTRCMNFGMNIDDDGAPPGGHVESDTTLPVYIEFAYKIFLSPEQQDALLAGLPKWVKTDYFAIDAKAAGNPTKDQVRLMMQALLADRFKLAVHFETKETLALALVPIKPGKIGPRLRPHSEGLACDAKWISPPDRTAPTVPPGGFMPTCGSVAIVTAPDRSFIFGARDLTMDHLALYLPTLIHFGRSIVNQTGLDGGYDLSLQFTPERGITATTDADNPDSQGTTAFEALKEQLGLTLKPIKAQLQVLVVDHVEQPSPN
jgi:bla regulator protein blaR1